MSESGELVVITQQELSEFGCPHCSCTEGGTFISFGTCSLWSCESCAKECCVVETSVKEVFEVRVRNTDIKDLIGHHPFKYKNSDSMIPVPKYSSHESLRELF